MSEQQTEEAFPRGWNFYDRDGVEADGPVASGTYVRVEEGPLSDGSFAPIVVLNIDGEERSIWCLGTVLLNQFGKAFRHREVAVGEQIVVTYTGEKKSAKNFKYRNYVVRFPDAPAADAKAIFGAADPVEEAPVAYESAEDMASSQTEEVPY